MKTRDKSNTKPKLLSGEGICNIVDLKLRQILIQNLDRYTRLLLLRICLAADYTAYTPFSLKPINEEEMD